jgi:N-acetylhexosamine 1-kinase
MNVELVFRTLLSNFSESIGQFVCAEPYGDGHLHKTYRVRTSERELLCQALGQGVFTDIPKLMRNTQIVCTELCRRLPKELRAPELLHTTSGDTYCQLDGQAWRVMSFLDGTCSFTAPSSADMAFDAGGSVARFWGVLQGVSGIEEVLPGFQNLAGRFDALRHSAQLDILQRVRECREELAFLMAEAPGVQKMQSLSVPRRNTHGDLKFNNLLFDKKSKRMVAVVDLDTCAPGRLYYDFGELVRAGGATAAEDDPSSMGVNADFVVALAQAFYEELADEVLIEEWVQCAQAPRSLALTLAARFLSDHLSGDTYFGVHYEGQNLQRARAQLRLAQGLKDLEPKLEACLGLN